MEARKSRADRHDGHLMEAPQWSLAMEARKSVLPSSPPVLMVSPQWSLAMEARKSSPMDSPSASGASRNGAWSWRPGRDLWAPGGEVHLGGPQWSLAMEARKRPSRDSHRRRRPDLPQWSLAMEARKSSTAGVSWSSRPRPRNGAWPWRPGRGPPRRRRSGHVRMPAMEPGHGGQEETRRLRCGR